MINERKNDGAKITHNDTFTRDDMVSYLTDYEVDSSTARGAKCKGSIYIRGVTGTNYDSFKFILEKNTDFHQLDVDIILKVYEEAFKPKNNSMGVSTNV